MGVMSRRVLPACGNLCFFCPSLRARSRQPVKRYKKLLTDIFPRSQDGEPNDRKISKLCEYASKNPLRVPKITKYLEQRCYKELRSEHIAMAKVVPCIYRKLLASCKEQMPLFATSLLSIVRTLLDQSRQDDMQVLGCLTLVDFLNNQTDSTYMFNLEGLIPKLCQLSQEVGEDERGLRLRSAGLQALASMVRFMGEYSHISMDFDDIVSATLENYVVCEVYTGKGKQGLQCPQPHGPSVQQILKVEDHVPFDSEKNVLTLDSHNNPNYWSRVCLQNMANLAEEATTVRRVLEPLFRYFDNKNHWSPNKGMAQSVLYDMQMLMEKSGKNSHLLSILVKHLDHKNVARQPEMQVDIVKATAFLTQHSKLQSSAAVITAISDLMRHLRKCFQCSIEASNLEDDLNKWNSVFHSALEDFLIQLTKKVGDIGPILDVMAVVLENISMSIPVARTTVSTVYRTARIAASLPNILYHKKAFPEALFHQLLLAMTHPDPETRVGSHRVFSAILVPTMTFPWTIPLFSMSGKTYDPEGTVLVALSGFSASGEMLERMGKLSITNVSVENGEHLDLGSEQMREELDIKQCTVNSSLNQPNSIKLISLHSVSSGKASTELREEELTTLRLSSHQVSLLLSSIWVQAISQENTPANYEAIAHTFNLALVFSQAKASSHAALVRCFQLAFSLRTLSLDHESCLPPSCRRCLFTMASSMLIFSAKAGRLHDLILFIKSTTAVEMDDPHLCLIEDSRLQVLHTTSNSERAVYGYDDDTATALALLSGIQKDDSLLKETVASHILNKFENLSEEELLSIKEQLMQEFSPDEAFPHGAPLFMDTPRPCSPLALKGNEASDQIMPCASFEDEDVLPEPYGSQSNCKPSESVNALDILDVNQLLESVLETARQVASLPVSTTPVPYDQMKSQCEALVVGKQQKMSVLLSFKQQHEALQNGLLEESEMSSAISDKTIQYPDSELKLIGKDSMSSEHDKSFRLPPSSPYDKFMKAAGC